MCCKSRWHADLGRQDTLENTGDGLTQMTREPELVQCERRSELVFPLSVSPSLESV